MIKLLDHLGREDLNLLSVALTKANERKLQPLDHIVVTIMFRDYKGFSVKRKCKIADKQWLKEAADYMYAYEMAVKQRHIDAMGNKVGDKLMGLYERYEELEKIVICEDFYLRGKLIKGHYGN